MQKYICNIYVFVNIVKFMQTCEWPKKRRGGGVFQKKILGSDCGGGLDAVY